MGWNYRVEPVDFDIFIEDEMKARGLTEYQLGVGIDPRKITSRNIENGPQYYMEKIEVWYISESVQDGEPYIGLMLVDFMDYYYSEDPMVQSWGSKFMSSDMGPFFYTCPVEYLDRAPVRSETEQTWRDGVYRRIAANS